MIAGDSYDPEAGEDLVSLHRKLARSNYVGPSSASARFGVLELRKPYRQNLLRRHSAVAAFFEEDEPLRIGQAGRNDHFPTRFQLMDQRRRYEVRSRCHDYLIERGVLGPTMIAIGNPQLNVGAALLTQSPLRLPPKLLDDLDAVHFVGQLRQDCGLIAEAGADFEHIVLGAEIKQIRHQADNERLRDRLVESDRQWNVGVSVRVELDWHKLMSRNLAQGRHNPFIKRGLADRVAQLNHPGGNFREHLPTQDLEVFCSHREITGRQSPRAYDPTRNGRAL
jgi:hypothetical protein